MIVCGDTMLARDFILNDLKPTFDLDLQVVSGIVKRNAATFKSQIIEGSQCNATYKKTLFGVSKTKESSREESESGSKFLKKLLLFEDVDIVFSDESDFYSQLSKLLLVTKVPVLMTASNFQYISKHLLPILNRNRD